jgi:hypothetical protein
MPPVVRVSAPNSFNLSASFFCEQAVSQTLRPFKYVRHGLARIDSIRLVLKSDGLSLGKVDARTFGDSKRPMA